MALFPGALPVAGTASSTATLAATGHTALHNTDRDEMRAVATKLGTGASTPAANQVLRGTGAGASAFGQVALTGDVTGVLPVANGGTGQSTLTGLPLVTPAITSGGSWSGSPTISTPVISDFSNATHSHANAAGGGLLTHTALPTGAVVQVVGAVFTEVATGTAVIPFDDTIPQITEGTEFITQAIIPKSATNILVILVNAFLANSAINQYKIAALFQDSTTDAIAANTTYLADANGNVNVNITQIMVAGTVNSTTFRVRCGSPGVGTTTFNGNAGARVLGAISKSSITIMEYKA